MKLNDLSRRQFLYSTAALGMTAAVGAPLAAQTPGIAAQRAETKLRVLSIGVQGTIGGEDRKQVNKHDRAEIVGLCDVDSETLAKAAQDHPEAFTCADYREAFDKHGDQFDAVIVATPDHSHCAIMTLALSKGKHVYGQKPLVHQLEELQILADATHARPDLVTQTANQRIQSEHRRAAVDILRAGTLGKVIEVHVSYGAGSLRPDDYYFGDGVLSDPIDPPAHIDYNLWLNGAADVPCRANMLQRKWRSWWDYGCGQIGDWVVHLVDVVFYAYPELISPDWVCTRTPTRDLSHFHAEHVTSTLSYAVSGEHFANSTCNFYFYDSHIKPTRKQLGLGEGDWPDSIFTAVVCEGGTLVLAPSGPLEVWRDGKKTEGLAMPGLPEYETFNHWHAWVDKALGVETPHLWTPFDVGLRCTEVGLLAVKAAKYPGQVLHWDRSKLAFTNHAEATASTVRRVYRRGFEPVRLG